MKVLRTTTDGRKIFWCPGCDAPHALRVSGDRRPRWEFNGDEERPTFQPSVLSVCTMPAGDEVCHSFVTDGNIKYLDDTTHALRGRTVAIPAWPYAPGEFGGLAE